MIDVWKRIRIAGNKYDYNLSVYTTIDTKETGIFYIEHEGNECWKRVPLEREDIQDLIKALQEIESEV